MYSNTVSCVAGSSITSDWKYFNYYYFIYTQKSKMSLYIEVAFQDDSDK